MKKVLKRFTRGLSFCLRGKFGVILFYGARYLGFKTFFRVMPPRVMIEPNNTCNLRCPACATGSGSYRDGEIRPDTE